MVEGTTKTENHKTIQQNTEKLQNCNLTKFKKYGIINTVKERNKDLYKPQKSQNQQNTQKSQGKFGENAD